jgi:hypothetical protein
MAPTLQIATARFDVTGCCAVGGLICGLRHGIVSEAAPAASPTKKWVDTQQETRNYCFVNCNIIVLYKTL